MRVETLFQKGVYLPEEVHLHFAEAPEKLRFATGGGLRSGTKAVRMRSDSLGERTIFSLSLSSSYSLSYPSEST